MMFNFVGGMRPWLLFFIGVSFPLVGYTQVQRGAFLKQTLELAPAGHKNSVALAKAYCLDENLPGPSDDTNYRTLLHGGETAFVYFGDEKINLGTALKDGKIRIRGPKTTEAERFSSNGEESEDRLPLYVENLTHKPVRVAFEKAAAVAADDWLDAIPRTRLTPEAWKSLDRNFSVIRAHGDPDVTPSWNVTSVNSLWQSLQDRGVQAAGLRRFFGLQPSGGVTAEVLDRLKNFQFVSELHLGTAPAWLVQDKGSDELIVLSSGGSLPPPPPPLNGDSVASSSGDSSEPPPSGELRQTAWGDYRLVYAAQRKTRLEDLSRRHGVDFAVLREDEDAALELFTPAGSSTFDLTEPQKTTDALRDRQGRPLIVLRDQTFWDAEQEGDTDYEGALYGLRLLLGRDAEFYVDHDPERAVVNVKARPLVRDKDDVAVYEGGLLDTRGHSLRALCAQHNLAYVYESASTPGKAVVVPASNLVIISAHKNADYRNYLMRLAEQGQLKGKAVLLGSCASRTDAAFVSELLARSGARVAVRFGAEIQAKDAAALVNQFGELLRQPGQGGQRLEILLDKALTALIEKADSRLEAEGFRRMQNFLVQVS